MEKGKRKEDGKLSPKKERNKERETGRKGKEKGNTLVNKNEKQIN